LLCGDRSALYKSDYSETIHDHILQQHNLDKNGKDKDEAEILKILRITTEHLYDNQCRSFNFTSSMAIERVRELKTGSNLGRYNNFMNMVKDILRLWTSAFYIIWMEIKQKNQH
jgi:hypothetical protein